MTDLESIRCKLDSIYDTLDDIAADIEELEIVEKHTHHHIRYKLDALESKYKINGALWMDFDDWLQTPIDMEHWETAHEYEILLSFEQKDGKIDEMPQTVKFYFDVKTLTFYEEDGVKAIDIREYLRNQQKFEHENGFIPVQIRRCW